MSREILDSTTPRQLFYEEFGETVRLFLLPNYIGRDVQLVVGNTSQGTWLWDPQREGHYFTDFTQLERELGSIRDVLSFQQLIPTVTISWDNLLDQHRLIR